MYYIYVYFKIYLYLFIPWTHAFISSQVFSLPLFVKGLLKLHFALLGVQSFIDEAGLSSNQRVIYHLPKNLPRFLGREKFGRLCMLSEISHTLPHPPQKKIGWPQERIKSYHLREIGCKTRDPGPQDATAKTSCRHKGKKGTLLLVWNHIDC